MTGRFVTGLSCDGCGNVGDLGWIARGHTAQLQTVRQSCVSCDL